MSSGLTNDMPKPGDVYRHQNGIEYRVDAIARVDNEYQELVVVATGPDGITWARAIGNFLGLRDGKARFEKVQSSFDHPGVTFSGRLGEHSSVVRFDKGSARVVTDSLQVAKGCNGTWVLNADGSLSMGVKDEDTVNPYAIINGVTYLNQAELEKHWLNLEDLRVSPTHESTIMPASGGEVGELRARVQALETKLSIQVQMLVQPQKLSTSADGGYDFNNPQDLPPVGCDLLIKVPAGTKVSIGDPRGTCVSHDTEADTVFKAFRTKHLANRSGDMEYRLPDDSTVTGRFPWTYP